MSFVNTISGTNKPNFLESEVGLVLKTVEVPASMGVADGPRKVVPAGTIFPANTASATGIIFEAVDVTSGDMPGSVMVAGRVAAQRITVDSAAKTALEGVGIKFVTLPETTR